MTRTLSWLFSAIAFLSVLLLAGVFFSQSLPVWQQEGAAYIAGHQWFYRQHQFGALSLIYGSVVVSLVALLLAGPLGLGTALFVAEYLPHRLRLAVKLPIELLAGIPSVVYGLLGILLLRDWVYDVFERFAPLSGDTLLTAGILLAIMLLPTVVSLCEDAFRAIPSGQRRAARALGLARVPQFGDSAQKSYRETQVKAGRSPE
jgi:phosphate transport system permease protein